MRRSLAALALASACVMGSAACSAPAPGSAAPSRSSSGGTRAHAASPVLGVSYYLALGDSLAQGVQPNAAGYSVETGKGYPNLLYAALRLRDPRLRLVKLGCPGETTSTMIHGGICRYPGGSQLAAATSFLRQHRGRVSLVTIDIGANDAGTCLSRASTRALASCVGRAMPRVTGDLATILARLRRADPGVRIIGMNYYLPALAYWRDGRQGEVIAHGTEIATAVFTLLVDHVYANAGARVADVFAAFHTGDFTQFVTVPRLGRVPRNVAAICRWTWECSPSPRGPNPHANPAGYRVIARAFLAADGY